jgi:uncharacterized protein
METLMRCPVDNETLVMADRNGVEIDYCPKCRGVWLDRGELDKIIERGMGGTTPAAAPRPVSQPEPQRTPDPHGGYRRDDDDDYRYKKKRKESFLGELFDF